MPGRLVNVREAAARIGCNPETIRRWIRDGRLKAQRENGRLLMDANDIESIARGSRPGFTFREWADEVLASMSTSRRPQQHPSAGDLVMLERRRREAELYERLISQLDRG